jgi:putative Mg2+ transporter-C (MgtC) family protein
MAIVAVVWSDSMEVLRQEFSDLPDLSHVVRTVVRLVIAVALGGLVGWQRAVEGKPAGIRTHMLVTLGAALFVQASQSAGLDHADASRVIQGVVTGIGFVGAGAIMKVQEEHIVHGLTTAASIWVAAGVGVAAGLGRVWWAVLAAVIAILIMSVFGRFEHQRLPKEPGKSGEPHTPNGSRVP